MTWQPIETAPKDGTPILIFQPDRDSYNTHIPYELDGGCFYKDDPRLMRYDDLRFAIGYWRPWRDGGWGNRNDSKVTPTHWMPLPPPPEQEEHSR